MAAVIKDTYETATLFDTDVSVIKGINMLYDHLVAVLAVDNPGFDKKKFAEACVPEMLYHR